MDFVRISAYENLAFGDIIWAKRYDDEVGMLNIPERHREGPYIVIGKEDEMLICAYGTSTLPKGIFSLRNTFQLMDLNYPFVKNTFINLGKICYISYDRFIKKMGHLNEIDKKYFYKKIDILKRKGFYSNVGLDYNNILLEPGDIINKDYFIIDMDDKYYYCLKMCLNKNVDFCINIDGINYSLDFFNIKKIDKNEMLIRDNFVDNITLKKILATIKYKLEQNKRKFDVCRGSLIRLNGILYYVYGEIGNEWMIFPLTSKLKESLYKIIINKKCYYTDFCDCIRITKNENGIEIKDVASELEMKEIQKQKKSYKKSNNKENNKLKYQESKLEIKIGSIVKNVDNNELYIVILKTGEELVVIKYDNYYFNFEYVLGKLLEGKVEVVGCFCDFNLKQVLSDLNGRTSGYINEKRLKKMIKSL